MRRLLILTLTLASLALGAQPGPAWEHGLDAGLRRARAERRNVFVDVWAEWCGPCQFLRNQVFPTPEAGAALAQVVPVSLMVQTRDRQDTPEGRAATARFRVNAFPTLLLLDPDGNELRRKVGAFRNGQELAAWIAGSGGAAQAPRAPAPPAQGNAATKRFESALSRIAARADQLDEAFNRFAERYGNGRVRGHYDRPFYALWEEGALEGNLDPGGESRLNSLQAQARKLREMMRQAEEEARRSDVLPGDQRDLRARYNLVHPGWER
jgi:thiol-disulfide isomerase/thioredoxin